MTRVRQFMSENRTEVRNQFIIETDSGHTIFQSYNSLIADHRPDGSIVLGEDWDYSNTTRKYLYQFLRRRGYCIDGKKDVVRLLSTGRLRVGKISL